ncbi:MAG TPA: DUF4062 domain-containing protein [Planctomycetaceae bacterium]|nr:DUF4062 domain-containing protein [Planctomycetaceae bacterium]
MGDDRPRIFVCSTIYDFRDLRSALRHALAEYGLEVILSEHNDSSVQLGSKTYESWVEAIDTCDVFVLLIGGRAGGWFDKAVRISITRMAYRHAYQRFLAGKLKILAFVRKEVWDIREDRNGLRAYMAEDEALDKKLSADDKQKLLTHSSRLLPDADAIFEFLNEAARSHETKKAPTGKGDAPAGHGIYPFSSFGDILNVCKGALKLSRPIRRQALIANLLCEIEMNVAAFLTNDGSYLSAVTRYGKGASKGLTGGYQDVSELAGEHLASLGLFVMCYGNIGARLRTTALGAAISSGEFFESDGDRAGLEVGSMQKALLDLDSQINFTRRIATTDLSDSAKLLLDEQYKANPKARFTIPNQGLLGPLWLYNACRNILTLSVALYKSLGGNEGALEELRLLPTAPLALEIERVKSAGVTRDDARTWIDHYKIES